MYMHDIGCWGNDCHTPWCLKWHWSSYHKWCKIYLFSSDSHFYISFEWWQTKVSASLPWPMQILDSTLNITFNQLSTHQDCFSIAQFKLIFFCLCLTAGFHLTCPLCKSNFIQLISYNSVSNINSYFDPFTYLAQVPDFFAGSSSIHTGWGIKVNDSFEAEWSLVPEWIKNH